MNSYNHRVFGSMIVYLVAGNDVGFLLCIDCIVVEVGVDNVVEVGVDIVVVVDVVEVGVDIVVEVVCIVVEVVDIVVVGLVHDMCLVNCCPSNLDCCNVHRSYHHQSWLHPHDRSWLLVLLCIEVDLDTEIGVGIVVVGLVVVVLVGLQANDHLRLRICK
jgi:hypothetical protein